MELKFIWVKNYGQVKNLGVNFNHSNKDVFTYDGENIHVTHRRPNILNFGEKITGVTALAGQNGSGKSSLCQVVLNSTATYTEGLFGYNEPFDGIVCYDKHIFYHDSLALNNWEELTAQGYTLVAYKESPLEKLKLDWKRQFAAGGFIYYSNLFDFSTTFEGVNLKNISSANLLYEDAKYTTAYYRDRFPHSSLNYWPKDTRSEIRIFQLGQGFRTVKYYLEDFANIPFKGPDYIIMKSSYSQNNRWLKLSDELEYTDRRTYDEIETEIFSIIHPFSSVGQAQYELEKHLESAEIIQSILKLYRLNLLRAHAASTKRTVSPKAIRSFVYENILSEIAVDESERIRTLEYFHSQLCQMAIHNNGFTFQPYQVYTNYMELMQDWRFAFLENIYIPNTETGRGILLKFMNAEHEFLNYNIEGGIKRITNYLFPTFFSSGELAYLSLFSRLHDAIKFYVGTHHNKESLIIFIDEGDAGFHPKWNKMYLNWILKFLNNRPEKVVFQLILSTHSPYLLSDLTSENVILMRRGQNGETEIVPTEAFETFGANIHELLSNNFFLDDGTIGEFAKTEINKIIDKLYQWRDLKNSEGANIIDKIPAAEKSQAFNLISNIADQIVRGKLFEIYSEVFEDENAVQMEIAFLEERIKKLRNNDRN